ncbi:MAG: DUF502 domain-containing protein [Candidatus Omnitrophica bacterium]|nr:DUF502 domain-containing protein [Candidatus Omnitrophota bacterium]
MSKLQNSFLTGVIVLLPIVVTAYVVWILLNAANDYVINPFIKLLSTVIPFEKVNQQLIVFLVKVLVFLLSLVLVTFVGLATRVILFKRMLSSAEGLVSRIPLLNKVYVTIQQIGHAFLGRKQVFQRVVLVEYPRKGIYMIGFVTSQARGETQEKTPSHVVNVFVPTTPNPTSGFLLLVSEKELIDLKMSVEDAMKLVVSGGVVGPRVMD